MTHRDQPVRVFISSTYDDLIAHRKAVEEVIARIRWQVGSMEHFGARPQEPTDASLEELGDSDVLVGIYAHRYGTIPEGMDRSITEIEFDAARAAGKPCYCYVVADDHPWTPTQIEQDESRRKLLKAFKEKVSRLVRARFTDPDNLAKQVAADLQREFAPRGAREAFWNTLQLMQGWSEQQIKQEVGPKYIRELYVDRVLDPRLRSFAEDLTGVHRELEELLNAHAKLDELCRKNIGHWASVAQLGILGGTLGEYFELSPIDPELCYPAKRLHDAMDATERAYQEVAKSLQGQQDWEGEFHKMVARATATIVRIRTELRPVVMVVDRAGGGKTNLLCRATEEIGASVPCFFMTAKSIEQPSARSIIEHLADAYPVGGGDPVAHVGSLALAERDPSRVVVVIDGINESVRPVEFNSAVKGLIRKHHNLPVRYIVSCRDIYWRYFEDDWWKDHCRLIARDELSRFRQHEFAEAAPKYLTSFGIRAQITGDAEEQLRHPLLLRFFCEAYEGETMGPVFDIRLRELFDTYCARKYKHIQTKLGLVSAHEVDAFVSMIAQGMLAKNSRQMTLDEVRHQAAHRFGDGSVHALDSRYVAILDEDIIIEQKPFGSSLELRIEFVYDEFMEYIIARALWSQLRGKALDVTAERLVAEANGLLAREAKFVSVAGVVVYLGEFLALFAADEGVRYVRWFESIGRHELAARLLSRWPKSALNARVFDQVIALHEMETEKSIKQEAWRIMELLGLQFWPQLFSYLLGVRDERGAFRPSSVFQLVARLGGGNTEADRMASIEWLKRQIKGVRMNQYDKAAASSAARKLEGLRKDA